MSEGVRGREGAMTRTPDSPNVTPNAMNLISCFAASFNQERIESIQSKGRETERIERKEAEDLLLRSGI